MLACMGTRARLGLLVVAACGSSSSSAKTPEGALHRFIDALHDADTHEVLAEMVGGERYAKALTCDDDDDSSVARLYKSRSQLEAMPDILKGVSFEVKGVEDAGDHAYAKGDVFRGCVANEPFRVHGFTIHKHLTADGVAHDNDETAELIQLDGSWWVLANH